MEIPTSYDIPHGYAFNGISCGIKQSGEPDLALIVADQLCTSFGAFTQNIIRASSVDWNEKNVGSTRAIIVNSGNANACTGPQGERDTLAMAVETATRLGCTPEQVLVMSTGIIGEVLPMDKMISGIDSITGHPQATPETLSLTSRGFMTSDRFSKVASRRFKCDGQDFSILGIAKGAGMIGPKMATMLSVFMTDFPLIRSTENLQWFKRIIDQSFNRISVDGHTSTSDQVVLLSRKVEEVVLGDKAVATFFENLWSASEELAKMIPKDGEGATHLISITVSGPQSEEELATIAKTIADSPLVKTAVFGADPNWGRIVSAAGYSGVEFSPETTTLKLNGFLLYSLGTPATFDAEKVSLSISENEQTEIQLQIGAPIHSATFWTSDLTYEYVKINAEYHT